MSIIEKVNCRMELARLNIAFSIDAMVFGLTRRQSAQRWRRIRERYIKEHPGYGF